MKKNLFLMGICLLLANGWTFVSADNGGINKERLMTEEQLAFMKNNRLYFIENKGQWPGDVLFLCRMRGLDAWITKYGVNYSFYRIKQTDSAKSNHDLRGLRGTFGHEGENQILMGHRVLFELVGHQANPKPEGLHKQEGYHNYFIGNDPSKHATNVGLYKEAWVKNVYEGIDMRYYFDEGYLRFDFVVHPGADPSRIKFRLNGANDAYLKNSRKLAFTTRFGEVVMSDLHTYQDGREVESRFEKKGDAWQVALGKYDIRKPLFIDPLIYSTYIGGPFNDYARAIKINASGTAYICGVNINGGYDVVVGSYDNTHNGSNDAFVTMVAPGGGALNNSTYLGGSGNETAGDIFIDNSGGIYVVGVTSSTNFPVSGSSFQPTHGNNGGNSDGFITKFNSTLTNIVYSSYIGGNGLDGVTSVFVNNTGEAYITGYTSSTNFTVTSSPVQSNLNGLNDIFVSKVNSAGTSILLSTYIGGSNTDEANAIKVDASGNVYVAGKTLSTNFPMVNPIQSVNNGSVDIVFCKINPTFSNLFISTYLGGTNADVCYDMEINSSNEIYLTGVTASNNFTTTPGCYDASYNGGQNDCFLTKLNSNGTIQFSTFFGGSLSEEALGIELDAGNNIYITGQTSSLDFPVQYPDQATKSTLLSSEMDAFILKFNPSGNTLLYSTYLGGASDDVSWDIALDNTNNVYITGQTNSNNFDVTPGVFQSFNEGSFDVFVTKLCPEPIPSISITSSTISLNKTVCINNSMLPITFSAVNSSTAIFSGLPPGVNGSYNSGSITIAGTPTSTGSYVYSINVLGANCSYSQTTGTINVIPGPVAYTINPSGSPTQSVCLNQSIAPVIFTLSGQVYSVYIDGLPPSMYYTTNYTSNTLQIGGTPTVSGVHVYTVILYGTHCTNTFTGSLSVSSPLSYTLSSPATSTNQTVCEGQPIQPVTYSVSGLTSVTFTNLPAGVTGTQNAGVVSISGAPNAAGYYNYIVGFNGACGSSTMAGVLNVDPQPTLYVTGGSLFQNVCIGNAIQTITLNAPPSSTIQVNGLPNGVISYSNTMGNTIISGTPNLPAPQNEFTIIVKNNCGEINQTGTIVVNSGNASAVQISPPGTETQTVCEGTNITPIMYSISGVSSVSLTGLAPGISYTLGPGTCIIQGSPYVQGYYPYQLLVNGCNNNTAIKAGTIEVIPSIAVSVSDPSAQSQTVCTGRPIGAISYSLNASSVNTVQVLFLPDGVGYMFDIINQEVNITGTPTVSGTYSYSLTSPGVCFKNGTGVIRVEDCLQLSIPTGLAGNGVWYIENIEQDPNNEVFIFGRWGNKIAHIKGYNNKDKAWGSVQYPINVPEGTYYYVVKIKDKKIKGYVEVLR